MLRVKKLNVERIRVLVTSIILELIRFPEYKLLFLNPECLCCYV